MPNRIHTIVAGISELAADDPTLRAAGQVARWAGAELHLVHAYQLPPMLTMSPGMEAVFPGRDAEYARALERSLEAAACEAQGCQGARCRVVLGTPAQALARVATEVRADLLVVGAARRARLGHALLGTAAQRVLREATVPVLVTRRPVVLPPRRVLLTTDLSELSASVHETALDTIDMFFRAPEKVRSLLVLGWSALAPAPLPPDALDRAARAELEAFLRERAPAGPPVEPVVRTGFAADEIVAEAREWEADLLVVGTHARGWGARIMLGSVAEAALRDAPCNVLAVPPLRVPAATAPSGAWAESPDLQRSLDASS